MTRVRRSLARSLLAPLLLAELLGLAPPARAELTPVGDESDLEGPVYVVKRGDTLGALAARLHTTTTELLRCNPGLEPDRLREGQRLRLDAEGRRVEHVVATGETLSRVAAQYEVTVTELLRWNAALEPSRLRVGQKLVVYTRIPDSRSQSVGTPNAGGLLFGARLPVHDGYVLRDPARAYGTAETIHDLVTAFDALRKRDPRAPRVRVHDISLRDGGRISDHHSHQSGRDVDITYYQKQCTDACPLRQVAPSELDVERQWTLIRHWLERGRAEAIFIERNLQARLYQHARKQGASREQLMQWFQYPRAPGTPAGVIRHVPKHADHLHVRFVCHDTDPECQMFRVTPVLPAADEQRAAHSLAD